MTVWWHSILFSSSFTDHVLTGPSSMIRDETIHLSFMQVTNLAWGAYAFPTGYTRTQNTAHVNDLIKHGADYLVSSWNNKAQAFVAVLGNNSIDFNYYGPVEEYEIYNDRPAFYINAQAPGLCSVMSCFDGQEGHRPLKVPMSPGSNLTALNDSTS